MIKGKKIHLVAFEAGHWPFIQKWLSEPAYKYYFKNIPRVFTSNECAIFPEVMNMNVLMILESVKNHIIGMATWDNVRVLPRTCEIGFLIDQDYQGMGYTKDAFMHFMNYLFSRLGFHKVSAKVAARELTTCGKTLWGGFANKLILRDEFYMDGKWQDDVLLSVLDHEFQKRFIKFTEGEGSWGAEEKEATEKHHMKIN